MSLSEHLDEREKEHERVLNWYAPSLMLYPAPVAVTWCGQRLFSVTTDKLLPHSSRRVLAGRQFQSSTWEVPVHAYTEARLRGGCCSSCRTICSAAVLGSGQSSSNSHAE